jgi:CHAT domain-containing protein/tetratricopeptide (TPR) repeat protein
LYHEVHLARQLHDELHLLYFVNCLNDLAALYHKTGDHAAAEPLLRMAIEVEHPTLGEAHPRFAASLSNLAALYMAMGDYAAAEPLLRRAIEIKRAIFGEDHPRFAVSQNLLALLYAVTNREDDALVLIQEATAIDDQAIGLFFSIGSPSEAASPGRAWYRTHRYLSLILGHLDHSPKAVSAALDLTLRRKALGAEGQAARRDALLGGRYPHLQPRLRELQAGKAAVVQKTLAGPGPDGAPAHRAQRAEWDRRCKDLERELARAIPEMNLEIALRAADRRAVASGITEGVALVEFFRLFVINFKPRLHDREEYDYSRATNDYKPPRYVAFVLRAGQPDTPQVIDLGEGKPIDGLIADFRTSILGETDGQARRDIVNKRGTGPAPRGDAGEALRAAVFDPLVPALGGHTRLLLAPDGLLAYLPFEVLPLGDGRCLIDDYRISYLSCGRDVLRFGRQPVSEPDAPLVMADPDFDLEAVAAPAFAGHGFWSRLFGRNANRNAAKPEANPAVSIGRHAPGCCSRDLTPGAFHFDRLPSTRAEGEEIGRLLGVAPQLDAEVLEGRLRAIGRSPRVLHLATHGFFLPDQPAYARGLAESIDDEIGRFRGRLPESPMLRSGLALAGANTWLKGGTPPADAEDGLLTAEDVSGLDLTGTELVVLSACETGLGDIQVGEGVFGLRRAFVLAGAKTLVMSLWKVPDEQTRELMVDFYRRLLAGEGRAEALRQAQLAMKAKYPDPFYWGAFICQGDPAPLAMNPITAINV